MIDVNMDVERKGVAPECSAAVWLTMMVVFHSATLLWSYSSALPMAVSQAWGRQQLHPCWLFMVVAYAAGNALQLVCWER
jgi:hypothetical protein